jgi:hypothetical protein
MQKLKYLGVPIFMNGQNYYLPSLSTKDFRANYYVLTAPVPEDAGPFASFDRFLPIILLALNRNYPDVIAEQLADWLDLHTFKLAVSAVQDASGIEPVAEGE